MKKMLLLVVLSTIFVCVSCSCDNSANVLYPNDGGSKTIAEFGGVKLSDKYIKTYVDNLNDYLKSRYNTPERKEELVSKIVEGELIARKAVMDGALDDPILLSQIKNTIARYYSGTKMKVQIEESLKVTEDDMKKYYEEKKESFNTPERVKASHILIKIDENRDKEAARKLAEQVAAEARKSVKETGSFAKLAEKYSEDEGSKKRGGDLGYFERTEEGGKMVKEFSDGAFALKEIGDISDPVESQFGFHIIKLTGKKEKIEKTFEDVKMSIENTLKTERRKNGFEEAVNKIKNELGYKFDKDAAQAIEISVSDKAKDASEAFDKNNKKLKKPMLSVEQLNKLKNQKMENSENTMELKINNPSKENKEKK